MTTKVHAIYRNGVFLPSTPPPVADGAEVELIVTAGEGSNSLVDAFDEIAHLPPEGPQDGFSGADHDRVPYDANKSK
jgi:predicted DNA-binding antitoxin AbrB/MazE fold protein